MKNKSIFHFGQKGVYYYKGGTLVEEKTEAAWMLRFLYTSFLGSLLRPLLKMRLIVHVYAWYKSSWFSKKLIKKFIAKHEISMDDFIDPDGGYGSVNDFFIRSLKPGRREIDSDEKSLVSPADGKVLAINLAKRNSVIIKGKSFTVAELFNSVASSSDYEGGTLFVSRLAPYDYHRYHFPIAATPDAPRRISGTYESVNPFVYSVGVQPLSCNERQLTILRNKRCGPIIMVSVGALFVGAIHHILTPREYHEKGDEMGYFSFGGSTLVLAVPPGRVRVRDDIAKHSQGGYETAVCVGESIATFY